MPQPPDWNKYLDAGVEFVAMTRAQARQRAKVLVGTGQLAQEQVQGFVDELVEESKRRTDGMLDVVRKEIQRQVKTLGIATKDDLARLEARLAKPGGKAAKSGSKASAAKNGKAASKPAAKKTKSTEKKPAKAAKKSSKQSAKKAQPAKKRPGRTASKAAAS